MSALKSWLSQQLSNRDLLLSCLLHDPDAWEPDVEPVWEQQACMSHKQLVKLSKLVLWPWPCVRTVIYARSCKVLQ